MVHGFDDEERRRIAAERLKTSLTTDAASTRRRHWRDRWSEVWMNGCVWTVFIVCAIVGVIWVIGSVLGLIELSAAFIAVFGSGAVIAVLLFVARIALMSALRRGRGQRRE